MHCSFLLLVCVYIRFQLFWSIYSWLLWTLHYFSLSLKSILKRREICTVSVAEFVDLDFNFFATKLYEFMIGIYFHDWHCGRANTRVDKSCASIDHVRVFRPIRFHRDWEFFLWKTSIVPKIIYAQRPSKQLCVHCFANEFLEISHFSVDGSIFIPKKTHLNLSTRSKISKNRPTKTVDPYEYITYSMLGILISNFWHYRLRSVAQKLPAPMKFSLVEKFWRGLLFRCHNETFCNLNTYTNTFIFVPH